MQLISEYSFVRIRNWVNIMNVADRFCGGVLKSYKDNSAAKQM